MKLTQTGLPRRAARSIVPPPTWGTTRLGAASPTWNAEPDPPLAGAAVAAGEGFDVPIGLPADPLGPPEAGPPEAVGGDGAG